MFGYVYEELMNIFKFGLKMMYLPKLYNYDQVKAQTLGIIFRVVGGLYLQMRARRLQVVFIFENANIFIESSEVQSQENLYNLVYLA